MAEEYPDGFGPGWEPRPDDVAEVVESLPIKSFGATPAMEQAIPDELLGHKIFKKVTGQDWPVLNQGQIGSCVAHGGVNALAFSMIGDIVSGDAEEFRTVSREVAYGLMRVQVGHNRLGRGDGGIGAWQAKAFKEFGTVEESKVGQYSESRCRQYGASGPPAELVKSAAEHKLSDYTQVNSFEQLCSSLASGYGVIVCSNRGFSMQRDDRGFCRPRGVWHHAMAFIGYRKSGSHPGALLCNSWGGSTTTGPRPDDIPPCTWWVEPDVVNYMLRQDDSFAMSGGFSGFPARKLNWII